MGKTWRRSNQWEKRGDEATNMNENTEQVLRLFIIEQTQTKTKSEQSDFYKNFQKSKTFRAPKNKNSKSKPININLCI